VGFWKKGFISSSTAFAVDGIRFFTMTGLTPNLQKAMFKPAALQKLRAIKTKWTCGSFIYNRP
jgi:hypothetical protein